MPLYNVDCGTCGRRESFAKLAEIVNGCVSCDACGESAKVLPAGARMVGVSPTNPIYVTETDTTLHTNADVRRYEADLARRGLCAVSANDGHIAARREGIQIMGDVRATERGYRNAAHEKSEWRKKTGRR